MKKIIITLLLLLILVCPNSSFAHALGQPPYFKVNGVFTDYYPTPTTSLSDFELPQDIANGTFLVSQNIDFEIDTAALPIPEEIIQKTKFLWDFGDGTTATGLENSHSFAKPGTYFIDVRAGSGEGFEPQLLQSTAINILPDQNYKLPKAVIEVNGKQAQDPLLDIIDVNFSGKQKFSGKKSDPGSSEITQYLWDMGDMTSAEGPELIYSYKENPYTVFPVLRIKTKDGFIADSFVQIKDETAFEDDRSFILGSQIDWKVITTAVIVSLILAGILTWLISKFLFKKNKSAS